MRKLLLAGLVIMGFAACSDDSNEVIDGGTQGKYGTYLQLTIKSPETTRTSGTTTENGSTAENEIKNVDVYLVHPTTGGIQVATRAGMSNATKTDQVEVPTGNYKLFVVVNPTGSAPKASGTIQQLIENVTEAAAKVGYKGTNGSFLMSTACDGTTFTGEDVAITTANTASNPVAATAKVDRIAAKITDSTAADLNGVTIQMDASAEADEKTKFQTIMSAAELKGLVLINGNQKFNLFQEWKSSVTEAGKTITSGKNVLMTPQGILNGTGDLMTGYYNPITNYGKVSMASGVITAIEDLTVGMNPSPFAMHPAASPLYTIENRPEFMYTTQLTSGMAQTTGVIYQVIANSGNTFYAYKGKMYPDKASLIAAAPEFTSTDFTADASDLRLLGLKVYEDGRMYYSYFIQDKNYKVSVDGGSEVSFNAVMRNAYYKLKINSITDLGDDIPGGGTVTPEDPNPPIITEKSYMTVTVTVNPWVLSDIGIDF